MPNSRSALRANTRKRIQEKCNKRVRGHSGPTKRWWGPRTCAKRKRVERAKRERRRFFGDDDYYYDDDDEERRNCKSTLQLPHPPNKTPLFSALIYIILNGSLLPFFSPFFFFFPHWDLPLDTKCSLPMFFFFAFLMTQLTTPICRFSFQTKKEKKKTWNLGFVVVLQSLTHARL